MVDFHANKWKYSTIGLLAILAVGFSFPQAFAAASATLNDIFKKLTTVETKVDGIKAVTDKLPADLASQSAVEDAMFSQVQKPIVMIGGSLFANIDQANCTSSSDFIVHVSLEGNSARRGQLVVEDGHANQGGFSIAYTIDEPVGLTFGREGSETLIFKLTQDADAVASGPVALVTLQTTQGATASCTVG